MQENSQYDRKSIRVVRGNRADFKELAKDCVGFANGLGGRIDIGIEDNEEECPKGQRVEDSLVEQIREKIPSLTYGVSIDIQKVTNTHGDEYIALHVFRSMHLASTSDGRYYIRIADTCRPLYPEELSRVLREKGAFSWELERTKVRLGEADRGKVLDFLSALRASERVSASRKEKSDEELLAY